MNIGGFQKLTLIDYPGKIATTVFTVGCSFKCSFCHNPELVIGSQFPVQGSQEKEFFSFLEKRKGKLEGVCITGGEPTIQPDIIEFIGKIKSMGFLVKLDSNGTRPDILKKALDMQIVDYIAMDIKNSQEKYLSTSGLKENSMGKSLLDRVKLSVGLIMYSGIPYEFRTTVVPGIHEEKDFEKIAEWIKGADAYYLQEYRELRVLDPKIKEKTKGKTLDLDKIKENIKENFGKIEIRR